MRQIVEAILEKREDTTPNVDQELTSTICIPTVVKPCKSRSQQEIPPSGRDILDDQQSTSVVSHDKPSVGRDCAGLCHTFIPYRLHSLPKELLSLSVFRVSKDYKGTAEL